MIRSGNPALKDTTFTGLGSFDEANAMSIQGTVNKTFILLALVFVSAILVWGNPVRFIPFIKIALFGGFIIGLVTVFKKDWAPVLAPIYAILEGMILGGISVILEKLYPGIVQQAVMFTFGVLFSLLLAYKSRLIQPTENLKLGIVAATGGIALLYLANLIMSFFGKSIHFIHESGPIGIGFSIIVVIVASLNLVLDFDFIEKGARSGSPKYMEWYGAFGLMVTLIWLYLEILNLLSKARKR